MSSNLNGLNRVNFNNSVRPSALHGGNHDALNSSAGSFGDKLQNGIGDGVGKVMNMIIEGDWKALAISVAMIAVSLLCMFGLHIDALNMHMGSVIGQLNNNFTDVGAGSIMPIGIMGAILGVGVFGVYSFILSQFGEKGKKLKERIGQSPDASKIVGALGGLALAAVGAALAAHAGEGGVNWGGNASLYGGFALIGFGVAMTSVRLYEYYKTVRVLDSPPPAAKMAQQMRRDVDRHVSAHNSRIN
jgi:hypothetical protein